ncbi:hypothetical protein D3C72_2420060 [compost metagenome]
MTNSENVLWINNPDEIISIIEKGIVKKSNVVKGAQEWFKMINQHPPQEASKRIWDGIKTIISKE